MVRRITGFGLLGAFVIVGYGPAMFCRDVMLTGYVVPESPSEVIRFAAALAVGIFSMVLYAGFAWVVMLPAALRKFPYPARVTGDQKRDLNDKRFFYCLLPWFGIVAVYAAWDMAGGFALPFSEAILQSAYQLAEKLL